MAKISVIVPIYNVEKQLRKCIDSLINQQLKDVQIILVNDGSTDNSAEIAKEYANRYENKIIFLNKENGGLSDARNYGIKYAQGDYISFVDSDDYVTPNLYNDLIAYTVENYDVIKFKFSSVNEAGDTLNTNKSPEFENKTGEEAFNILYKTDKMMDVAWSYIYRRDFWKSNNFEYAKGLYHEDFGLTPLVILKASKVASTNIDGYRYVQTANSITRGNPNKIYKRTMDLLEHYDNMLKKLEEYKNISNESKENIKIYYTNSVLLAVNNLQNKEDQDNYIKEIKKRKLIKNIKARNGKQFIKKLILNISIKWYLKLRREQ